MIKIIIADDHPIVRAGMKQIISEASDLVVAEEAWPVSPWTTSGSSSARVDRRW